MKRAWMLLLAVVLCFVFIGCSEETAEDPAVHVPTTEPTKTVSDHGSLVILFTGDLRNIYERDSDQGFLGYAALAAYRDSLIDSGSHVILIDGGEAAGPDGAGAFEGGDPLWEIIDATGYDIRVPGIQELSSGIDALQERFENMENCTALSCNLVERDSGAAVFDPYVIVSVGDVKVGFVGITTPDGTEDLDRNYSLSNENGTQAFYDLVQRAIDDASYAGADFVIGIGNLGTDLSDSPWTSAELIANTTGLSAFLDCGIGAVIEGNVVVDKDDFEIPVCATGSEFCYIGQITLDLNDGSADVALLDELPDEDRSIKTMAEALTDDLKEPEDEA